MTLVLKTPLNVAIHSLAGQSWYDFLISPQQLRPGSEPDKRVLYACQL